MDSSLRWNDDTGDDASRHLRLTRRYRVHTLVWYEVHGSMESAILREKALKAWKRIWKIQLIEDANPEWRDLYPDILQSTC